MARLSVQSVSYVTRRNSCVKHTSIRCFVLCKEHGHHVIAVAPKGTGGGVAQVARRCAGEELKRPEVKACRAGNTIPTTHVTPSAHTDDSYGEGERPFDNIGQFRACYQREAEQHYGERRASRQPERAIP